MYTMLAMFLLFCAAVLVRSENGDLPKGNWKLLVENGGVSAMHMTLLHTNKVIIFDRTDAGASRIKLPDGRCRKAGNTSVDCWAHSVEYDVVSNTIRPLELLTSTWCSSAIFAPNGSLVQIGGSGDGERVVRLLNPCQGCDWMEIPGQLTADRWYASSQILPDGRAIIVGGRLSFNYEFFPKQPGESYYSLPFLRETNTPFFENLYPFLHLLPDGNLFIFANTESILLDYSSNLVLKRYQSMPGEGGRSYPSTGSSVMLPLSFHDKYSRVEIMICGGAPRGAIAKAVNGTFLTASTSCGRIVVTDATPSWDMESMPIPRVMGDMILLPTGEVLILNGCSLGVAGWELGRSEVLFPVLYTPSSPETSRFTLLKSSTIARMYHSTAIVLPDGRVLVAGSNAHEYYRFTGVLYPTELRIEAFSPHYLDTSYDRSRPTIVTISTTLKFQSSIYVVFQVQVLDSTSLEVTIFPPPFSTHSYSMNQRLLRLEVAKTTRLNETLVSAMVVTPPNSMVAPLGYYLLSVVNKGIPSPSTWVRFTS